MLVPSSSTSDSCNSIQYTTNDNNNHKGYIEDVKLFLLLNILSIHEKYAHFIQYKIFL